MPPELATRLIELLLVQPRYRGLSELEFYRMLEETRGPRGLWEHIANTADQLKGDEKRLQSIITLWEFGFRSLTTGGLQRWLHQLAKMLWRKTGACPDFFGRRGRAFWVCRGSRAGSHCDLMADGLRQGKTHQLTIACCTLPGSTTSLKAANT